MIKDCYSNILDAKTDVIAHQVNCQGVMGAGLAKEIRSTYPNVFREYKNLCKKYECDKQILLGSVQYVKVDNRIIANCFAQLGYGRYDVQTNYNALKTVFETLLEASLKEGDKSIAIPYKMGCGLAGGDWDGIVYPMIESIFKNSDIIFEIWHY